MVERIIQHICFGLALVLGIALVAEAQRGSRINGLYQGPVYLQNGTLISGTGADGSITITDKAGSTSSGQIFLGGSTGFAVAIRNSGAFVDFIIPQTGAYATLVSNTIVQTGYIEQTEAASPGNAAADRVRLFTQDNGAGKTQLMAIFSTGAAQVVATQP